MRRKFGKLLMILGGLLIAASLALTAYNIWDSWRADKAAQKIVSQIEDEAEDQTDDSDDLGEGDVPLYKEFPDMEMPVKMIDGYAYIGVLEIPSQDLKLPVMENWDYTRMRISPCRYSGSIYKNNMVIAGHDYFEHFTPIKSLKIGDVVIFTDMNGNRFEYTVGWTEIIVPDEVALMTGEEEDSEDVVDTGDSDESEDTEEAEWDLTLFTCTLSGSDRYTVRCILEDEYE